MSITIVNRKVLWSRAGDQCAFPGCEEPLTVDLHNAESEMLVATGVVIGEEAHIRSGQPGGPRHDPAYPLESVDSYANLILLCPTHHALVDKNGGIGWSTDQLLDMKRAHEAAVRERKGADGLRKQEIEERLVAAIAHWEQLLALDDWDGLTFGLNGAIPSITKARFEGLIGTGQWLLAKQWPPGYPKTVYAFTKLRLVIGRLIQHINISMEERNEKVLRTNREYKKIGWNPDLYDKLIREFRLDCAVTWFLAMEITRAVNLVILSVMEEIDPLYRFEDGVVLMREGDGIFVNRLVREEYPAVEWNEEPYTPSLAEIRSVIDEAAHSTEMDDPTDVDLYNLALPIVSQYDGGS